MKGKTVTEDKGAERFADHWLTVRPYLFDFPGEEAGGLDEEMKLFVRVAETLDIGRVASVHPWGGNGRRPSDRVAAFKLFLMKHARNWGTSKDAPGEVRRRPAPRRLCGWESPSGVPSGATLSREFAASGVAQGLPADFIRGIAGERLAIHRSVDSTGVDARERAATGGEKARAAAAPTRSRSRRAGARARTSPRSPRSATGGASATARGRRAAGAATSCT